MAGVDLCQLLLPQTGVSASVCECVVGLYGTDSCMLLIRAVLFLIEILSAHSHCCSCVQLYLQASWSILSLQLFWAQGHIFFFSKTSFFGGPVLFFHNTSCTCLHFPDIFPISLSFPASLWLCGWLPHFCPFSVCTYTLTPPLASLTTLPLIYHTSLSFKLTCNMEKKKKLKTAGEKLNAFNKWLTSNRPAFQTLPIHSPMKGEKSFTRRDKAE